MLSDNSLPNNHLANDSCSIISTFVESSLQINSFYAKQSQFPKKSNERKPSFNKELRKKDTWWSGKNKAKQSQFKANSKPIQSQSKPIKANQSQF